LEGSTVNVIKTHGLTELKLLQNKESDFIKLLQVSARSCLRQAYKIIQNKGGFAITISLQITSV